MGDALDPLNDYPEFAVPRDTIRKNVSSVAALASEELDSLFRPVPGGIDCIPSAFFLSSCDVLDLKSKGIVPFACSLESLSMSLRALGLLMDRQRKGLAYSHGHKHAEGMNLLLADGLILLSYRFLTDLDNRELPLLAPIIIARGRLWTGQVCGRKKNQHGMAEAQKVLLDMALQAIKLLSENRGPEWATVEHLALRMEHILSEFRDSGSEEEKSSAVRRLEEVSESLSIKGSNFLPLADYVSLITETLVSTYVP